MGMEGSSINLAGQTTGSQEYKSTSANRNRLLGEATGQAGSEATNLLAIGADMLKGDPKKPLNIGDVNEFEGLAAAPKDPSGTVGGNVDAFENGTVIDLNKVPKQFRVPFSRMPGSY